MKNLKGFKEFEAIYSLNWNEEYKTEYCNTFELYPGDKFEMTTGAKAKYIEDPIPTKIVMYVGNGDDFVYFKYADDGLVYKTSKKDLYSNFLKKL